MRPYRGRILFLRVFKIGHYQGFRRVHGKENALSFHAWIFHSRHSRCAKETSMKISGETSQKIKNMGLLCAILVVSIHVEWPHDQPLSVGWFMYQAFAQGLSSIAVPFFFVVSGFFLASHFNDDNWYRQEITKRVKTLLVPFVFWSIFALVAQLPLSIVADKIAHRPFGTSIFVMHNTNWLRILGLDFTDYPIHVPLWYVRCLFLFVLTVFVFKCGIAKFGYVWLIAAFIFNLIGNHIPNEIICNFFSRGYSTNGIFYFSVGLLLHKFSQTITSRRYAVLCGSIGVCLLTLKLVFAYNAWQFETCIGKLSLPFLLYFTWCIMTVSKLPQWLIACSFPIFLMHTIALSYIGIAMKHLPTGTTSAAFVGFIGSIIISMAIAAFLRRFLPRFANVIFGGR